MLWYQKYIQLRPRERGFHLVTGEIVSRLPEIARLEVGLATFFIQHTSASLAINENADADVRHDFESFLGHMIPERLAYFRHTLEGDDDIPAHIKASLIGTSVTVPIGAGRLLLGTWQGIYLGEHRRSGGARSIVATLFGELTDPYGSS